MKPDGGCDCEVAVESKAAEAEGAGPAKYHPHCEEGEYHHHGRDECEHHHGHGKTSFTNKKLDTSTLLYLATLGGAHVCCLQDRIGSFEVGKAFDALYVSLDNAHGNPALWGGSLDEVPPDNEDNDKKTRQMAKVQRWLEWFLFTEDNRNIRKVWVQRMLVDGGDMDANVRDDFEG